MREYDNPNLVKNKTAIFLNLHFGLDFMSDSEAAEELKIHFYTQECAHPDVELMHMFLQNTADETRNFLNRAYELSQLEYNPIDNYDRYEEWEDNTEGKSDVKSGSENKIFEYPMNTTAEKAVNRGINSGDSSNEMTGKSSHKGHIRGNIGVKTVSAMLSEEMSISERLRRLKKLFCDQYEDLFMLSI